MKGLLKNLIGLSLVAVTLLALAGCSKQQAPAPSSARAADERMKVVLCIGRRNDLSFQQSAYEGLMRVGRELAQNYVVEVREMGDDTTIWENGFYEAADSGAAFVVGVGYQNKENFEVIPPQYPNTKFILFDQDVDYASANLSNVLTVLFDSNESGFLAGAAAAYWTVSDKALNRDKLIGFVGGINAVTINNFLVGYAEGAHYIDPEVRIRTAYIGDFIDTARAKDLTMAQISEGVDIIFQVAGGAGNGIIEAAAERQGVMAIGVDADQYQTLAGTDLQHAIITSALKRLDNALFKILGDYVRNPASVPFGTTATYGLKEDAVGIVFNENLEANLSAGDIADIRDILGKLQAGEIRVSQAGTLSAADINAIVNP